MLLPCTSSLAFLLTRSTFNLNRIPAMTHNPVVRLLSILAVILIPIIACGESGSSGTYNEQIRSTPSVEQAPDKSSETVEIPESPPEPAIEEISAAALDAFYEENERAGDEKYKGRMLIVNGIVYSIESSFVSLEGEGMMDVSGVYCHYNSSQYSAVAQLREGHRIRIQGVVRGQDFMGGVDIEDCVILSSSYSNNTQDTKSDFERELDELETLQKDFERELDEEIDKLEEEWEEAMNELDNELDDIFDDF